MDTERLGCVIGAGVLEIKEKMLARLCESLGTSRKDLEREYLILLMFGATWKASQMLGQYAEATLDAMHAAIYGVERPQRETEWEAYLCDRYAGYYAAIEDKPAEHEGDVLLNVARYFSACCRGYPRPLIYERLVPDMQQLQKLAGHGVRANAVPELRSAIAKQTEVIARSLAKAFAKIAGMPRERALDEFTESAVANLQGTGLDPTYPPGHQDAGRMMLRSIGERLLEVQNDLVLVQNKIVDAARRWAEPPAYSLDFAPMTEVVLHFGAAAKATESAIIDFVKRQGGIW